MSDELKRVGALLGPHRDALLEAWIFAVVESGAAEEAAARTRSASNGIGLRLTARRLNAGSAGAAR